MEASTGKNLNSVYADERQRGFRDLLFSDFVEEEFLQYFSSASLLRSRMLPILAIVATLISMGVMLSQEGSKTIMMVFDIMVLLPVLGLTLFFSTVPGRHRTYQALLAVSALLIGLIITSVVTRASLAGAPYYLAAEVAWIFVVWLILGLPFRHAAVVALAVSGSYIFGSFNWSIEATEVIFSALLLVFVNGVGAFCSYQLEYALRRSFLESKVLSELAERDGLTSLYNRRSYDQYIDRIWRQSRREKAQLTFMLIDIDHFKAYNDCYGHQAGDDALKEVANVIKMGAQRPLDFGARFGGEEFALVLYGPGDDYGRELPEQIRRAVTELKIVHQRSPTDQYLTVSIGVAMVMPGTKRSLPGAIQMADEALYQAKEEGRNRAVVKATPDSHIQTGRFRASRAANT